jgi:cephalosporin hydroxylase
MTPIERFEAERRLRVRQHGSDTQFQSLSRSWLEAALSRKYSYNFTWLGRPIIQFPQDIVGVQELIWETKPDLIVETGIAHGGSLTLSASMLALLDLCEAVETGRLMNPSESRRRVLGIDVDIRAHNRAAIEAHPMAGWIEMVEGSSLDPQVIAQVASRAAGYRKIMVLLDSNHTHRHVLAELEAYARLVCAGGYCLVFDTCIEEMPPDLSSDRPWGQGNGPKGAVVEFLNGHPEFEIASELADKLSITVMPGGVLKRVR